MALIGSILSGLASFALPKLLNVVGDIGKSIVEKKPFFPALGASLEKQFLGINGAKKKAFPIPTDLIRDTRGSNLIEKAFKNLQSRPIIKRLQPLVTKVLPFVRPVIKQLLAQPQIIERPVARGQRASVFAQAERRKRRKKKKKKRKKKKKKRKRNLPAKRKISRAI